MRMTIKQIQEACRQERERIIADVNRTADRKWLRENARCNFARAPRLLLIDKDGNRIDDCDWIEWRWKASQLDKYIADERVMEIAVDSGVDFAGSPQEYRDGIYEPEFFDVTVWTRIDKEEMANA